MFLLRLSDGELFEPEQITPDGGNLSNFQSNVFKFV